MLRGGCPLLQRLDQLSIAVRFEQIHPVPSMQRLGHVALFEPGRDQENFSIHQGACLLKRDPEFFVAVASLPVELPG